MANTNKVNGFRPVKYLNGAPWNGQTRTYVIPSGDGTATFVGDLVKLNGALDETTGLPTVIQAAASQAVVGVIVGFAPDTGTLAGRFMSSGQTNLDTPVYRRASTRRVCFVADDPNLLFEVQEDGVSDPLEEEDVSMNVNVVVGSGSTITGASGMQLDSDTHATTNTLPLKLMGVIAREDNEWVTNGQAYTRWLVKINSHQLVGDTGSTGV